jgi:hypothetical protein
VAAGGRRWILGVVAGLAVVLAACTGESDLAAPDEQATEAATSEQALEGARHVRVADCPVTLGTRRTWPDGNWSELTYRAGPLWVALYPDGVVQATPDDVRKGGSIAIKFGWWREVEGKLAIQGRRLDAPAAAVQARIPSGYGRGGFQSTAVIFAGPGCWEVTGSVGAASLRFVTRVVGPKT